MIESDNQRLLDLFKKNTEEDRVTFIQDIRDIAEEAVVDVLGRNSGSLPPTGDLAKHYYIENTLLAMQNLNFFAPKNGAKVIPVYTSPTALKTQTNLLARIWARAMYPPIPPVTALKKWSEYQDAWCATESTDKGKAQLGVATKYLVTPTELVVEHVPASGSLSINTAPRDVELWMDAGSIERAAEIEKLIAAKSPRYKGMGGCGNAPGAGFVCMVAGRYDIHSPNWVQRFPAFLDAETFPNFESRTFVARARTNWGGDKTCLYRFRLHGRLQDEQ
ncbi:hypothetical protein AMS68_005231 [Peltaster fructicola]|uniref:SUN domain-containing protein n=1 Tax=Peltaster fructicola TaxID=286661 RepID=A0A6H0XY99_9PEZI|nr:hypothetical protein AMS68_005231 [Peltaster fructicola]